MWLCFHYLSQAQNLGMSLSDKSSAFAELQDRITQLQRTMSGSEQERRILQDRLDSSRSVTMILIIYIYLNIIIHLVTLVIRYNVISYISCYSDNRVVLDILANAKLPNLYLPNLPNFTLGLQNFSSPVSHSINKVLTTRVSLVLKT